MRASSPSSDDFPLSRAGDAGYNLVMLMVLVTVLNIVVAASLPAWSAVIRRDKEEELIFRGLQYAEAIRVFQARFQRQPVRLEELIEVAPRSIRRLWKDPMTDHGKWRLISALEQPPVLPVDNNLDDDTKEEPKEGEPEEEEDEDAFGAKKEEIQVGPIKGVHSRSRKTSFLLFNGKARYDEWHFTVELLTGAPTNQTNQRIDVQSQTGILPGGGVPQMKTRWIGRPLPEFLQPPQGMGLPGDGQDEPGNRGGGDPNGRPPGGPRKP